MSDDGMLRWEQIQRDLVFRYVREGKADAVLEDSRPFYAEVEDTEMVQAIDKRLAEIRGNV